MVNEYSVRGVWPLVKLTAVKESCCLFALLNAFFIFFTCCLLTILTFYVYYLM